MTYVNEEKFINWYRTVCTRPASDNEIINEAISQCSTEGIKKFKVASAQSTTGKDEEYEFRVENLGCCGASTIFVYF